MDKISHKKVKRKEESRHFSKNNEAALPYQISRHYRTTIIKSMLLEQAYTDPGKGTESSELVPPHRKTCYMTAML